MPWAPPHLAVVSLVAATACAAAAAPQEAPPAPQRAPWWAGAEARREAARVLEQVSHLVRTSEQGDAQPAVLALRDPAWVVRRLAAVRLGLLGLPREEAQALLAHGRPGSAPPAPDAEPLRRAAAFAAARQVEVVPVKAIGRGEAARIVAALTAAALAEPDPPRADREEGAPAARRRALEGLLALRPVLPAPEDRAALAEAALALLAPRERRELSGGRAPEQVRSRGGRAVFRWLEENARYLAWDPRRETFAVDRAARAARQPTEVYRARQRAGR